MTDALLLLVAKLSVAVTPSPSPTPSGSVSDRATDDNIVRPGWLGFVVFLALAAAVYLLLKSFTRHLKRVNFDEGPPDLPPGKKGLPSGDGAEG